MCTQTWVPCSEGVSCRGQGYPLNNKMYFAGNFVICAVATARGYVCPIPYAAFSEHHVMPCLSCLQPRNPPGIGSSLSSNEEGHDEYTIATYQVVPKRWRTTRPSQGLPWIGRYEAGITETWEDRYMQALLKEGNDVLDAPLTYETLSRFKERQRFYSKYTGGRNLDAEWSAWISRSDSHPYQPMNAFGLEKYNKTRSMHETLNTGQTVPPQFNEPPSGTDTEQHRYLFACQQFGGLDAPLTFENLDSYVQRMVSKGTVDIPALRAHYNAWLQHPETELRYMPWNERVWRHSNRLQQIHKAKIAVNHALATNHLVQTLIHVKGE